MDLKARGMYMFRTLSYKGEEFDVVEVPLEDDMMDMYERASDFWIDLREKLLSELVLQGHNKPESSPLWRVYWGNHQRFFKHLCMSSKVPAVVKLCQQALKEDKCIVIGLQSTGEASTEEVVAKYGNELEDFVSVTRELLLKFVEENFPLPKRPESLSGEDGVDKLQHKRRLATPGVSFKVRARKVAKYEEQTDTESETYSVPESTDSDDEFQICEICNSEEERKKTGPLFMLQEAMHPACLMPPVTGAASADWSCIKFKEEKQERLQKRHVYIARDQERYDEAKERKSKILDDVHSLKLPNNPLDVIIDKESFAIS